MASCASMRWRRRRLALLVDLVRPSEIERLPESRAEEVLGISVPLIASAPFEAFCGSKAPLRASRIPGRARCPRHRVARPDAAARPPASLNDCDDERPERRYTETSWPHPLTVDRPVDGTRPERGVVSALRDRADLAIDTSNLTTAEMRTSVGGPFCGGTIGLCVFLISLAYLRDMPREGDLILDMRLLENRRSASELPLLHRFLPRRCAAGSWLTSSHRDLPSSDPCARRGRTAG